MGAAVLPILLGCALSTSACSSLPFFGDDSKPSPASSGEEAALFSDPAVAAEQSLRAAERAWRDGDVLSALAICTRALRGEPTSEIREELRSLRDRAKSEFLASQVIEVEAVPERDAVEDGAEGVFRIVFRNRSPAPIEVPMTADESSTAVLLLTVTRRDYDIYGNTRVGEVSLPSPLTEDLVLPPGGERQIDVALPPTLTELGHQGFTVLSIGGSFRPVALRVGESEFFDALPLRRGTLRVFMKGYEQLAGDPLGQLQRAIEKRSPPHILTATELLGSHEHAAARKLLDDAQKADPELAFVLRAALKRLG